MSKSRTYPTAAGFLQALTHRLQTIEKEQKIPINEIRRQISFERLLARIFYSEMEQSKWILKGGFALELRLDQARATKDVDLALRELSLQSKTKEKQGRAIRESLLELLLRDLKDFFSFLISEPVFDIDAAPYGGARFRVDTEVAGRTFSRFHLDVGVGDVVIEPLDKLSPKNWLSFAGIESKEFPSLSVEQHFAEKIHAYTLPRPEGRPNSRVKDLVDLVLLIETQKLNLPKVKTALRKTFNRRGIHLVPDDLPDPPEHWQRPFAAMAEDLGLKHQVDSAIVVVRDFYHSLASLK